MNFTYDINFSKDGEWGAIVVNSSDQWTGMVGELQRKEIDIGKQNEFFFNWLGLVRTYY